MLAIDEWDPKLRKVTWSQIEVIIPKKLSKCYIIKKHEDGKNKQFELTLIRCKREIKKDRDREIQVILCKPLAMMKLNNSLKYPFQDICDQTTTITNIRLNWLNN